MCQEATSSGSVEQTDTIDFSRECQASGGYEAASCGMLPSSPTRDHILAVVRDLCYVQWDPLEAVAPSHTISLWSRISNFRLSDLDNLLFEEKKLFLHQAPAMIVPTEDYPLFSSLMRRYPESISKSWGGWKVRAKKYLAKHELRKRTLSELKNGPLRLNQFRDHVRTGRSPDGWTSASDVSHMLFHLQMTGDVMIVGHQGNQNIWGLSEKFLPSWVERKDLTEEDLERIECSASTTSTRTFCRKANENSGPLFTPSCMVTGS